MDILWMLLMKHDSFDEQIEQACYNPSAISPSARMENDMFEAERHAVQDQIKVFCSQNNLPDPSGLTWAPIPFAGKWGISTTFFQLAALEARLSKESGGASPAMPVPQRAQAIAEAAARFLGTPAGFAQVEAVKGYLNLYFAPGEYARRVVDVVIEQAERFGSGERRGERVMIEFSQPNTHKAFHVGHLRSAILGDALCRIYDFAGYDVVRANYPGDMGLHVIKWLWNYTQAPPGRTSRQRYHPMDGKRLRGRLPPPGRKP